MKRILFVCTHNSARSQIAEGLLRYLGKDQFIAESAGLEPAHEVQPLAITVLRERAADPTGLFTKQINNEMLATDYDMVVTVCDHAKQHCPIFPKAKKTIHWSLIDPSEVKGDYDIRLEAYRDIRREIEKRIKAEILSM